MKKLFSAKNFPFELKELEVNKLRCIPTDAWLKQRSKQFGYNESFEMHGMLYPIVVSSHEHPWVKQRLAIEKENPHHYKNGELIPGLYVHLGNKRVLYAMQKGYTHIHGYVISTETQKNLARWQTHIEHTEIPKGENDSLSFEPQVPGIKIEGKMPSGPVILAACDSTYFKEHARALIYSANKIKKDIHIHVVNPHESLFQAIDFKEKQNINITFSYNIIKRPTRVYYSCIRFMVAKEILKHAKKVLIVDVDSIFKNDFDWPKTNYGYFPREHSKPELQVAAGCVYFQEEAINTLPQLENKITSLPQEWFVDQIALSWYFKNVVKDWVTYFDNGFMDWEFNEGSVLWTGKGARKKENAKYIKAKEDYENNNI